jgi:hypothetical protein
MVTTGQMALLLASSLFVSIGAQTAPIAIELVARVGTRQWTARSPAATAQRPTQLPRPVLTAKSGAAMHVHWSIVNQDKTGRFTNVTVHCVLQKQARVGQPELPRPDPNPVYESALLIDLSPQARSAADFVIEVPEPGIYLLRVETIGAGKQQGHESAALLDIRVL